MIQPFKKLTHYKQYLYRKKMKTKILAVITMTMLVAPVSSIAGEDNFYIKGNLGIGMPLNSNVDNLSGLAGSTEMSFDPGFIGSIAGGYDFANPYRIEIEALFRNNDVDNLSYEGGKVEFSGGDMSTRSFMVNGFYDIETGSPWIPFAGIGIGGSRIKIDVLGLDDTSDPVFTYQFIAGVSYALNEDMSIDAQYRYIGTADATVNSAEFDSRSNNLMLGLRYTF